VNTFAPDAFRLNAYRVLRIPGSASAADINKAAARMRRAEPELLKTSDIDVPRLGEVARGDADIRAAVTRLENPAARLTDRLLWFCTLPTPGNGPSISSAMDPAGHDSALGALFDAMQGGLDDAGLAAWVKALRAWHAVISDDDYWFLALIHDEQGKFEPAATSAEVDALRVDAVRIAAGPLVAAARSTALVADDRDTARRVLIALSSLRDTGPWVSVAMDEIATTVEMTRMTRPDTSGVK
jgi:hypothetical protein